MRPLPRTFCRPGTWDSCSHQVVAHLRHVLRDALLLQRVQRGVRGGYGQVAAAERGAVQPRLEDLGHFRARRAGTHGEATGDALRRAHDVGQQVGMLVSERIRAGAVDAALHLVADEQRTVVMRQLQRRLQVLLRQRVHAAFALDGLQQDGGDAVRMRGERLL